MEGEGGDAEGPVSLAERHHRNPDGALRRDVWPRIVDSDMRIPNHYAALLALAGETPETAQQIEKDLPRTGATFAVQGLLKPGASVPPLAPEIRTSQIRERQQLRLTRFALTHRSQAYPCGNRFVTSSRRTPRTTQSWGTFSP